MNEEKSRFKLITEFSANDLVLDRVQAKESLSIPLTVYVTDFNADAVAQFANDISDAVSTGQKIIPVVIDSFGGIAYSVLAMIDIIKNCSVPVATIAVGKAMSCGSVLFASGAQGMRYMTPAATLMVHEVSTGDHAKITEFKVTADEAERLNDEIFSIYDVAGNKTPGYFKKLVHDNGHADLYWTATDTLKHGLCDKIGLPKWKISVRPTIELL